MCSFVFSYHVLTASLIHFWTEAANGLGVAKSTYKIIQSNKKNDMTFLLECAAKC